jgi:uncharacterized repeat protein (TIGR01451 family)
LVLANWGGSNKVGDIAVYRWVGGSNPLSLVSDTNQADCSVASANDPVCAVVNSIGGETPPWSYTNKDGQHSYKATALFEGGIDLNAKQGGQDIGCFSSFMAATRSSHSTTAQLKDFALGEFPICGINVTKTGDTLGKIGDPVDYTITIENTGHATLYKRNINDTLLGAITTNEVNQANAYALTNTCGASLAAGATCTITLRRTVQSGDPDPLPNTVSILYSEHADFTGLEFPDSDDHAVNLFQPAVSIEKTGDTLSKIGDDVTYHVKIVNTSSADSPSLVLDSISDDVLGDLSDAAPATCDSIAPGASCEFNVPWTVAAVDVNPADGEADDPVINTVAIHFHPAGFPNDITATASHELNLFQPSITFDKTGDALSKVGDDVHYTLTLNNTSSADSPALNCTITDAKIGVNESVTLASGASNTTNATYTVQASDPDPLLNMASVSCSPEGFPNVLTASDGHSVNLFQPSVSSTKNGPAFSKAGDTATYDVAIENTSSADAPNLVLNSFTDSLVAGVTPPASCNNLAFGESCSFRMLTRW